MSYPLCFETFNYLWLPSAWEPFLSSARWGNVLIIISWTSRGVWHCGMGNRGRESVWGCLGSSTDLFLWYLAHGMQVCLLLYKVFPCAISPLNLHLLWKQMTLIFRDFYSLLLEKKHSWMFRVIWKTYTAVSKALSNISLEQMAHKNMHVLPIFGCTIPRNILETKLEIRKAWLRKLGLFQETNSSPYFLLSTITSNFIKYLCALNRKIGRFGFCPTSCTQGIL